MWRVAERFLVHNTDMQKRSLISVLEVKQTFRLPSGDVKA
jgi:hypothetical protein